MEGRQGTGMSAARRLDITGEALLTRPRAMEQEEAQALVRLALASGARQVTVGHGRDPVSSDNARMFVRAWQQEGGQVLDVVSWSEVAASLLLVGPRALEGMRGVDGVDPWVVHGGVMRGAQTPGVHAGPPTRRGREARVVDARWDRWQWMGEEHTR